MLMSLAPRSLARKLQVYIGGLACAVLAFTAWMNHTSASRALESQTVGEALKQVKAAAEELDHFVTRIGMMPRTIAARQRAIGSKPDPEIIAYLSEMLQEVPASEVYGLYLAFDKMAWNAPLAMPWVDRKSFPKATEVQYDYHDAK